ncbi:MAG: LexA family transcriptional regulator [Magnetococcales bacterium]|nr:LexA family transcriptional regulator [Magnetococcales bacterium]
MYTDQIKPGLKERIQQIIGRQPPYSWAKMVGIGKATFDGIWNKGAQPQLKTLLKIAWHTNISLSWLLTGKGSTHLQDETTTLDRPTIFSLPANDRKIRSVQENQESYLLLPIQNSNTKPAVEKQDVDQFTYHLAFTTRWVTKQMALDPKKLALTYVESDSMAPTLNKGDLILLDKRERELHKDGIYVMQQEENLIIKRLQLSLDGSIIIRSDNICYKTETIIKEKIGELNIVGLVIWIGKQL